MTACVRDPTVFPPTLEGEDPSYINLVANAGPGDIPETKNKRGLRARYPSTTFLALLCAGLLLVLVGELIYAPQLRPLAPPEETPAPPVAGTIDFFLPPLAHYQAILDRPLFHENRKPVREEPKPLVAAAPPAPLSVNHLAATVVAPGKRFAFFRGSADRKIIRIEQGQHRDGWLLNDIKQNQVLFTRDSENQALQLKRTTSEQGKLLALQRVRPPARRPTAVKHAPSTPATTAPPPTPVTAAN
jgi:hypothetical protein